QIGGVRLVAARAPGAVVQQRRVEFDEAFPVVLGVGPADTLQETGRGFHGLPPAWREATRAACRPALALAGGKLGSQPPNRRRLLSVVITFGGDPSKPIAAEGNPEPGRV